MQSTNLLVSTKLHIALANCYYGRHEWFNPLLVSAMYYATFSKVYEIDITQSNIDITSRNACILFMS